MANQQPPQERAGGPVGKPFRQRERAHAEQVVQQPPFLAGARDPGIERGEVAGRGVANRAVGKDLAAQGDERDVLILSLGYGPDENGQVTKDFGPLRGPAGTRLLNVAITRARHRAEIVSSIRADDIPESVTGDGVQHLRRYLSYAAEVSPAARALR